MHFMGGVGEAADAAAAFVGEEMGVLVGLGEDGDEVWEVAMVGFEEAG